MVTRIISNNLWNLIATDARLMVLVLYYHVHQFEDGNREKHTFNLYFCEWVLLRAMFVLYHPIDRQRKPLLASINASYNFLNSHEKWQCHTDEQLHSIITFAMPVLSSLIHKVELSCLGLLMAENDFELRVTRSKSQISKL